MGVLRKLLTFNEGAKINRSKGSLNLPQIFLSLRIEVLTFLLRTAVTGLLVAVGCLHGIHVSAQNSSFVLPDDWMRVLWRTSMSRIVVLFPPCFTAK